MDNNEKRKAKRVAVNATLSIHSLDDATGTYIPVSLANISSGGIAFKTKLELPINSFYDMLLEVSGCDKIETVIEIVRIASEDEEGIEYGCRFVGLSAEARFRIDVFAIVVDGANKEASM